MKYKEDKRLDNYWKLLNDDNLTKEHTEELVSLYESSKDPRFKCTIAIFLSFIKDDNKVPPTLFNSLNYWNDSGYSGWIMTSNARLFINYPSYRDQYFDLMLNGNKEERSILVHSLFFIPSMNERVKENINKFLEKEKNIEVKNHLLSIINSKEELELFESIMNKYDPRGVFKKTGDKHAYVSEISAISRFKDKGLEILINKIKETLKLFSKNPEDWDEDLITDIAKEVIIKVEKYNWKNKLD